MLKEIYALPIAAPPQLKLEPNTIVENKWRGEDGKKHTSTYTYPNRKYSARVVTASGTELLEVTAWTYDNILLWRTWQTDDRVLSQRFVAGKDGLQETKNGTSTIGNLRDWGSRFYTTKETEQIALKWAHKVLYPYPEEGDTLQLIQYCQTKAKHKKRDEERNRIRNEIANEMLDIRPVPKDFEYKVLRDAFKGKHYLVYNYQPKAKTSTGYCTRCGNMVTVKEPKNHGTGKCPCCHTEITYKSEKTMARCTYYEHSKSVAYLQSIPDGFCLRVFCATMKILGKNYRKPTLDLFERNRIFYNFAQDYEIKVFQWGQIWPNEPCGWHREYSSGYGGGYVYPDNLKKLFASTKWKYIPMAEIARHGDVDFHGFIKSTVSDKAIEHLAKHKLWNLVQDRIARFYQGWSGDEIDSSKNAKNIKDALSLANMAQVKDILQMNPNGKQLNLYKLLLPYKLNDTATVEQVIACEFGFGDLDFALHYATFHRIVRYVKDQIPFCSKETYGTWHSGRYITKKRDKTPDEVLHLWRDYIEDCEKLEFNLNDDFVLYPKRLEQAHQDTIAALEDRRNHARSVIIEALKHEKAYLEFKTQDFIIVLPKSAGEIVAEGKALHHCVGVYVNRVAKGDTLIFFIRTTAEPQKPFCTLELNPKTLKRVQVRADRNTDPPEEVMKFLKKWEKHLDKLKEKIKKTETPTRLNVAV